MSYIPFWSERQRRDEALGDAMACFIVSAIIVGWVVLHSCGCASKPPTVEDLPAEEAAHVLRHRATLARCEAIGRDAGSFRVYEDCTIEAGVQR